MLMINAGQQQQLGAATDQLFLDEVATRVSAYWPQRAGRLGPQALMARLRAVYKVALACGIKERPDFLRLANMSMALDDDLSAADRAWVHPLLGDARLRPGDRLDVLDAEIREWLLDRRVPL